MGGEYTRLAVHVLHMSYYEETQMMSHACTHTHNENGSHSSCIVEDPRSNRTK